MRIKIIFKYMVREIKDFYDNGCYLGNYISDFFFIMMLFIDRWYLI